MFEQLEIGAGLDFVLKVQEFNNDFLTSFAKILDFGGTQYFLMIIVTLIYWSFAKRLGLRIAFITVITTLVAVALKEVFDYPRPYMVVGDQIQIYGELDDALGFGFPSGHVSLSLAFAGYLAVWTKHRWLFIAAIFYAILQMWSRMYLGLHYPQDAVGGVIVGLFMIWLFVTQEERFLAHWNQWSTIRRIAFIVITSLPIAIFLWNDKAGITLLGGYIGSALGAMVEPKWVRFIVNETPTKKILRFALGIVVLLFFMEGLDIIFDSLGLEPEQIFRLIRYGTVGFMGLAGFPWLAMQLGLMQTEDENLNLNSQAKISSV